MCCSKQKLIYKLAATIVALASCLGAQDDALNALLSDLAKPAAPAATEQKAEAKPVPVVEPSTPAPTPAPTPVSAPVPAGETVAPAAAPAVETQQPAVVVAPVVEQPIAAPAAEVPVPPAVAAEQPVVAPSPSASVPAPETAPVAAGTVATEKQKVVSELMTLEQLRRQALDNHGGNSLDAARKALRDGDYDTAADQYNQAKQFIAKRPETVKLHQEIAEGLQETYYRKSRLLWKKGQLKEALEAAKIAEGMGYGKAESLVASITKDMEKPAAKDNTKTALPRISEAEFKDLREMTRQRLNRSRQYFAVGELDKANEEVELILRERPFDVEAMNMRDQIAKRRKAVADVEFGATRDSMIADVRKTWTPDRYAIESRQIQERKGPGVVVGAVDNGSGMALERIVEKKLKDIIIPEVSFRPPATIIDAVEFFNQASREYDNPELEARARGVNFVLKLSTTQQQSAEPVAADPFAAAANASSGASAMGAPVIPNISARFMSLQDALKLVCDVTGMKYTVKKNVVMVMPMNEPDRDLETRSYNVVSTMIERMNGVSQETTRPAAGGAFGGGAFGAAAGATTTASETGTQDWKAFFKEMGVDWPDRSSIAYIPTIGKLRVTNTPENLAVFEQVLEDLNVTPRQIEIEARFVEVSQNDLNSMGFEWNLKNDVNLSGTYEGSSVSGGGGNAGVGGTVNSGNAAADGSSKFATRVSQGTFANGMRFLNSSQTDGTGILTDSPLDDGFIGLSAKLGSVDLGMILHLLSQRSDTDLLSAPKIVTKSGQEAVMKVVEEFIYPSGYRVQISQQGTSSGSTSSGSTADPLAIVEPTDFTMRETGVILQVTPEVSAEGQMINLTLKPQVVEFKRWLEYGTRYPKYSPSGWGGAAVMEWVELPMNQPLFHTREATTSLSIYNGATVVIGGMITEARLAIDDKIPWLGDLPWVGFLFRSKAESSDKRNLLIFVTARLVDPAGRTIRSGGDSLSGATAVGGVAPTQAVPAAAPAAVPVQ